VVKNAKKSRHFCRNIADFGSEISKIAKYVVTTIDAAGIYPVICQIHTEQWE